MSKKRSAKISRKPTVTTVSDSALLAEVRELIVDARNQVAQVVNGALTLACWRIGDRVRREILKAKRAQYGERIVSALGRQLEAEFGRGYFEKSLRHMIRFAEAFPDARIVSALLWPK